MALGGWQDSEQFLFQALVYLIIASSVVSLVAMLSLQEKILHTTIYLKPNSFSNFLDKNSSSLVLGIENHGLSDANYLVRFFADNKILEKMVVSVENSKTREIEQTLSLKELPQQFPFKITIVVSNGAETQSIFYWIKS